MTAHQPPPRARRPLRSRVGVGVLRHRRARPFVYEFRHRVWYLALDLDELEEVARRIPFFSVDHWNALSFRRADHFGGDDRPLADAVRRRLAADGIEDAGGPVVLVTYPRVFGHVFNPVSFYLCHDSAGRLRAVLAEVSNTHGDQTVYTFEPNNDDDARFVSSQTKRFYVSPFLSMDGRYQFVFSEAGGVSTFTVNEFETDRDDAGHEGLLNLHTSLRLEWQPLSTHNLLLAWARRPLMTLQTVGLIHLHALRLWRRRAPFFKYDPSHSRAPRRGG